MRFTTALGLVPVLLVTAVACAPPVVEPTGDKSAAVSAGCTASREDILASTSTARQNAIQRGFRWLDNSVPYSQSASYEGYRTDCSGFVSMCWELGTSTDTAALYAGGTYDSDVGSWDDLLPADAIVHRSGGKGHVALFLGWEPDKSGVCVLEQASTASDMQFRVRSLASLKSGGYKPVRASALAGDTGGASGETAAPPPATSTTTTPPAEGDTPPADPSTPDSGAPGSCSSTFADVDVCNAALLTRGIECGVVTDACGNTVNCDAVPSFGCKAPKTCSEAQKCVAPACAPAAAASACASEKAKHGLACGSISDGCGGTVSCDAVPGFGCAKDETCSATHACLKNGAKTPGSTTEPPVPSGTVAPAGDPGDDTTPPTAASDKSSKTPSAREKSASSSSGGAVPSSGCSVSSSSRTGSTSHEAPSFLALAFAFAFGIARRRSRRE
jgi:hypothetical protein